MKILINIKSYIQDEYLLKLVKAEGGFLENRVANVTQMLGIVTKVLVFDKCMTLKYLHFIICFCCHHKHFKLVIQ